MAPRLGFGTKGPTCSGKVHGQVVHIRLSSRYSRQMPLDADLLNQAKAAEARVIDAEQAAEIVRAEFHGTVRRLQLAGASLREIAEALGLSHQRVHQIVEAAGGSRRWRKRRASPDKLQTCSFCGQDQKHVKTLIRSEERRVGKECRYRWERQTT